MEYNLNVYLILGKTWGSYFVLFYLKSLLNLNLLIFHTGFMGLGKLSFSHKIFKVMRKQINICVQLNCIITMNVLIKKKKMG